MFKYTKSYPKYRNKKRSISIINKLNTFFQILDILNVFKIASGAFILFSIILGYVFLSDNYYNTNFQLVNRKYTNETELNNEISAYLKETPFLRFRTSDLEKKLIKRFPLIKDAKVTKSFLKDGARIEISEPEPKVKLLYTDGSSDILSGDGEVYKDITVQLDLPQIIYSDTKLPPKDYLKKYIDASFLVSSKLEQFGASVLDVNLNRLGTLSVNVNNFDTKVYFDLNELNFSIDDQVKVIQNVLLQRINFKVADMRYNDLIVLGGI